MNSGDGKRILRKKAKKAPMSTVKSGILLSNLSAMGTTRETTSSETKDGDKETTGVESVMQSRTARVLLAGAGFLADAYDLFVINLVLRLLRDEYPHYTKEGLGPALEGQVASAALFGSILGQLIAGTMADIVGRKAIFVATAALISIGSLGSSMCGDGPNFSVYTRIACWRFFLGLGVGGEYPLAATVTSESSSVESRGKLMVAVFSMQGVGALLSTGIVLLTLSAGFNAGQSWRVALAFGAVPAIIAFPWRLRMHETETFERVKAARLDEAVSRATTATPAQEAAGRLARSNPSSRDNSLNNKYVIDYQSLATSEGGGEVARAAALEKESSPTPPLLASNAMSTKTDSHDGSSPGILEASGRWAELKRALFFYKWHMLGTALSWFLLDIDFYANGLFNHDITALIFSDGKLTTAADDAKNSAFITLVGLPGYFLSYCFIDRIGRKNIQMTGFYMMTLLYLICSVAHDWFMSTDGTSDPSTARFKKFGYLLVYSFTFTFSNFGPNTTSFVIPGEIYPAEVRATAHGISAASGKLGAAVGAYWFPRLDYTDSMLFCAAVAAAGVVVTYFFIPRYDSLDLMYENSYLPLEHACLAPNSRLTEQYNMLNKKSGLIHVIDSSVDLELLIEATEGDVENSNVTPI